MRVRCVRIAVSALVFSLLASGRFAANEGMWTFHDPPSQLLQERYGFRPTQAWLDHLRLSSVRLNDGGSGPFVSPNGLVMTKHHVVAGQLQKLSTPERHCAMTGFYAPTRAEELRCPDLELNVLQSTDDVTAPWRMSWNERHSPGAQMLRAAEPGDAPPDVRARFTALLVQRSDGERAMMAFEMFDMLEADRARIARRVRGGSSADRMTIGAIRCPLEPS